MKAMARTKLLKTITQSASERNTKHEWETCDKWTWMWRMQSMLMKKFIAPHKCDDKKNEENT
jgi:hypothetical protein